MSVAQEISVSTQPVPPPSQRRNRRWAGYSHLLMARMLELKREPEVVFWVFIFPLLLALGLGIAFRNKPEGAVSVAIVQGAESAHAMVMFTHPKESGFTLSSNDKTYHGNNARALVRQGYEGVVGEGRLTGKEHYYTGKTQSDAEIECAIKDHEL